MSCPSSIYQIYNDGFIKRFKEEKENLFISESHGTHPKHLVFLFTLAKDIFPPEECARIIMACLNSCIPDTSIFKRCLEIFQEIAPKLDIEDMIANFPNEDAVSRGLIVGICPVPFSDPILNFVFETVNSRFAINRIAFLNYLDRLSETEYPQEYNRLICGILESLSNDQNQFVRAAWVKPSLFYLKNNPHIKGFLKRMSDPNEAIEVRVAIALNFKEAYSVAKGSVMRLLSSTDNRVVAALIPQLGDIEDLQAVDLAPIYNNKDTTIRVFILRYLGKVKPETINVYIQANSDEINNELLRYLGSNCDSPVGYILKIMENVRSKEKKTQVNWRTNFEFLSLPMELLIAIGDTAFDTAARCVFRHPNCLMKKAVEVLKNFCKTSKDYKKQVTKIIAKLTEDGTEYSTNTIRLLQEE